MKMSKFLERCDKCGHIYDIPGYDVCPKCRNGEKTWDKIKRLIRYHIGHRVLGGTVKIEDIPCK